MNAYKVSWHASGYTGTFNYLVVAESLREAKEKWEKFVSRDRHLAYSWEKAKKAMKRHYGGYVTWKEQGETDKEPGCYKLEYNKWGGSSDHLRD